MMFDLVSVLVLVAASSTTMYESFVSTKLIKQIMINFAKEKHERLYYSRIITITYFD